MRKAVLAVAFLAMLTATPIIASSVLRPNAIFVKTPGGDGVGFTTTVYKDDYLYVRVVYDGKVDRVDFWFDADHSKTASEGDFCLIGEHPFYIFNGTYWEEKEDGYTREKLRVRDTTIGVELGVPNEWLAGTFGLEVQLWQRRAWMGGMWIWVRTNTLSGIWDSPEDRMDEVVQMTLEPETITETLFGYHGGRAVIVYVQMAAEDHPVVFAEGSYFYEPHNGKAFNMTTTSQGIVELANAGEIYFRVLYDGAEKMTSGWPLATYTITVDLADETVSFTGFTEEQLATIAYNIWPMSCEPIPLKVGYP